MSGFDDIEALLREWLGLDAATVGRAAVERAIRGRMKAAGLDDPAAFARLLRADPGDRTAPLRLGLVAENVVAVRSADEAAATLPPLGLPGADYLDRTLRLGGETVQVIDVRRLLPAELTAGLAAAAAEVGP